MQDIKAIEKINKETSEHIAEMKKEFEYHKDRIDNVLFRLHERGREYFNNTITITNIANLLNTNTIKTKFEEEVVGKSSEEIENHLSEITDWMISKNSKQWNKIMDYLQNQGRVDSSGSIRKIDTQFQYNRKDLLDALEIKAQSVVSGFDKKKRIR